MYLLARLALVLAIVFGGTGATAYAAQDSMPTDVLYPVKLFTEEVRLALTSDPQASFELNLALANRRAQEITASVEAGLPVSNQVAFHLNEHLQAAFGAAAQLEQGAMLQAMVQVQTMAQLQNQIMLHAQQNNPGQSGEALQLAQQIMNQVQISAQGAMEDPTTLRQREGESRPEEAPVQPDNDPGSGEASGPQDGAGNQGGNGAGGQPCETCTPEPGGGGGQKGGSQNRSGNGSELQPCATDIYGLEVCATVGPNGAQRGVSTEFDQGR